MDLRFWLEVVLFSFFFFFPLHKTIKENHLITYLGPATDWNIAIKMLLKQWLHVTQTSRHILTCKSPNPYRVINTLSEVMVFYSTFSHTIQLSKARESCSINHQSQIGFFKGMSSPSPPHPVTNSNITKTGSNIHTHFRQHTTHAHIMQTETDRVLHCFLWPSKICDIKQHIHTNWLVRPFRHSVRCWSYPERSLLLSLWNHKSCCWTSYTFWES